jgi:hypothetical protein
LKPVHETVKKRIGNVEDEDIVDSASIHNGISADEEGEAEGQLPKGGVPAKEAESGGKDVVSDDPQNLGGETIRGCVAIIIRYPVYPLLDA